MNLSSLKKIASGKDPTFYALRRDKRPPWNPQQRTNKKQKEASYGGDR